MKTLPRTPVGSKGMITGRLGAGLDEKQDREHGSDTLLVMIERRLV